MIVANDWTVDQSTGNIRYTGDDHNGASPSYATVLEFHRWLQDLADDFLAQTSTGDILDITGENPSVRYTDNIIQLIGKYNITDTEAEHLYDGSIIQGSGTTETIYDGIVNYGNADVQIQIIQNGAVLADDWWNYNGAGLNSADGISHRFMLKVRENGADIDGRRLIGIARTFGKTYSEFKISGTSRGNNVMALADAVDLNNQKALSTVAQFNQFTNIEGYNPIDLNDDGADEFYYAKWDIGGGTKPANPTKNDLYEYSKYLTRAGSNKTLYGLSGELFRGITHEFAVDAPTGTFAEPEHLTWNGGTGQLLAIDSKTAPTKMWIQLLTGVAPADNDTVTGASGATAKVNGAIVSRESLIKTPFIGASTGTALIGSYGLGMDAGDVSASDKFFDLDNTQITPPNNVMFTVNGLANGEDRVLVAPWDGTSLDEEGNPAIDYDQLTLSSAINGSTTSITVTTNIPADTPSVGTIRVKLASGIYKRVEYTAWSGKTFTVNEDFSSDHASGDVFISYIDTLANSISASFTSVYTANRNLVAIVRDGGSTPIKQFISSAVLTENGGSITVIRTSDE